MNRPGNKTFQLESVSMLYCIAPNTTVINYWYRYLKIVFYQVIHYATLWEELHLSGSLHSMVHGTQYALNTVNSELAGV